MFALFLFRINTYRRQGTKVGLVKVLEFFFYLNMMLCKSKGYSIIPVVGIRTLSTSCWVGR